MRENFASRIFCINFAEENYPKRETFLLEKREKFPKMENHSTEEHIFSFPKMNPPPLKTNDLKPIIYPKN